MDESSADVVFEVHCEQNRAETETEAETDSNKRAKLSPETFYAHRLVLLDSSSTLAELCKSGGDNNMRPLSIMSNLKSFGICYTIYMGGRYPTKL